jgi:mannose-6-phosphate isomerase
MKERIWGGKRLHTVLGKPSKEGSCFGESWEISGVDNSISVVNNGFLKNNSLEELIETYMGDLVGDTVYEKFGLCFPLLIKFIDAFDNLSIQVHPNDEQAFERHNSFGKTEMWYVIDNEPGAQLISGFNCEMTKESYLQHMANNTLTDILNVETVSKGDVFFLPAGRVHAIGKGILLAEIQQTSDLTYRIFDYNRLDDKGKPRELHTAQALDVIDFKQYPEYKTRYTEKLNEANPIVSCNYFTTNLLNFNKPIQRDYFDIDSFIIYICTEGKCSVGEEGGEQVELCMGESLLLPAVLKNIDLKPSGNCRILEVYYKPEQEA